MSKTEFVSAVAAKTGLSKKDANKALDAIIRTITEEIGKGEKVAFIGFGTFSIGERAARTGRNPQTGASIQIPASKVVRFKAGAELAKVVK
ncbi:MAG: HU family DNA-binding protein [Tannerella sp.]|jgi:DNA-binding protein HU-beta|nr:HU family DNA-binding protein [Tannerella sp.]